MDAHLHLDRESFQKVLANAFELQESGIGTHLLSALFELDRSVATDEPDMDQITRQVADLAREVANASGAAIALVCGDHLTYRAGSGCAAAYVGRNMTAILNATAHNQPRSEILRVENAQTDARIEAAICREFGANALLMLPIYCDRAVAGLLEVLFDEPHAFQHRELLAYYLMVELLEEAVFRGARKEHKEILKNPVSVPARINRIASQIPSFRADLKFTPGREYLTDRVSAMASSLDGGAPPNCQAATTARTITLRVEYAALAKLSWSVAAMAGVSALMIASWIAYGHRAVSAVQHSRAQSSITTGQQVASVPAMAAPGATVTITRKAASSSSRSARIRRAGMDETADDVTVRYFTRKPVPPPIQREEKQVRVGEDVTVRYFASEPADLRQR